MGDTTIFSRSGAGNTPLQPATHSTYTRIENSTEKKKIISVQTANKLCSKRKGNDTDHGTHGCKATIAYTELIGDEQRWAKEACSEMQTYIQGRSLRISHYTSDWDSKACKDIEEGQNDSSVILLR